MQAQLVPWSLTVIPWLLQEKTVSVLRNCSIYYFLTWFLKPNKGLYQGQSNKTNALNFPSAPFIFIIAFLLLSCCLSCPWTLTMHAHTHFLLFLMVCGCLLQQGDELCLTKKAFGLFSQERWREKDGLKSWEHESPINQLVTSLSVTPPLALHQCAKNKGTGRWTDENQKN